MFIVDPMVKKCRSYLTQAPTGSPFKRLIVTHALVASGIIPYHQPIYKPPISLCQYNMDLHL